ncbi:MAG TPA: transcription termination factor NusA [Coxiellaceae bacterium]|nr:transcription termination factor NusA [Coxiellaceae bacterium]
MKNKDMLNMVESLSNERGIDRSLVFEAVEAALAAVAAKMTGEDALMRVSINPKTGNYETFRCYRVIENGVPSELPDQEIALSHAKTMDPEANVGDIIEEAVDYELLSGRIAAQQAKQVIIQKVREAERSKIVENYNKRIGELVIGVVKRVSREGVVLDLGENAEALLAREDMMPRENFRLNERVRAYLCGTREERRGPQLQVSRINPEFLMELFKVEVPEIGEEVIEIKAAARDPGSRAKIAVKTNDGRIDPIGACVGMRGSRVQAVSNELGGERIDIVLWDDNPVQLVINAMAPAEVASIVADEESHTMDLAVEEGQLSQAIGRSGQNVRLASQLTGWILNVMSEKEASEKHESEAKDLKTALMEKLDIDEAMAEALVGEGFTGLEAIAYVPPEELLQVRGLEEATVEELQRRASDILLAQEIAKSEDNAPHEDLITLEGMTAALADQLAEKGIKTRDDLAELATDELQEIVPLSDQEASQLIMKAREHWFEDAR